MQKDLSVGAPQSELEHRTRCRDQRKATTALRSTLDPWTVDRMRRLRSRRSAVGLFIGREQVCADQGNRSPPFFPPMRVYVRPLPLGETHQGGDNVPRVRSRPEVTVLPYLVERRKPRSRGSGYSVERILSRFEAVAPYASFKLPVRDQDRLWASSVRLFLAECLHVLPSPPQVAVIVTHGNLIRSLLTAIGYERAGVPNGALVEVLIARGSGERKRELHVLFMRHCVTQHNVTGRGSSTMTGCVDGHHVEAARGFLSGLDAVYFSSAMPRAIATALTLQAPLAPEAMLALAESFGEESMGLSPRQVDAYWARNGCGSFCLTQPDPGGELPEDADV